MSSNTIKTDVDFSAFVSGLMAEGLVCLGIIEHPSSKEKSKDLKHAEMVVNTLSMIKEKTSGNLSRDESVLLDEILHQIRMAYISAVNEKDRPVADSGVSSESSKEGLEDQSGGKL